MQAQSAAHNTQYTVSVYLDDEDSVAGGSFTTDGNGNWGPGQIDTWDTTGYGSDCSGVLLSKYIKPGDPPPATEDGSYTVTIANTYPAWEPPDINGNGIQCDGITSPSDHVFYASSPSSFEVACSVAEANDRDHRYSTANGDTYPFDSFSYTWSCSAGSWEGGVHTGLNVTWVCPANFAGEVLISCAASDAAVKPPGEIGNRDDTPNGGGSIHVDVVKINLGVSGVSEANEEDPGAFVHVNLDNDDGNVDGQGNPIADRTEDGPISGENDTVAMGIGLTPSNLTVGSVVLSRSNVDAKVWSDVQKGSYNAVLVSGDSKTWDLSDQAQRNNFNSVSSNLWLEGRYDGMSTLTATVKDTGGQPIYSDTVNATFIAALCGEQPTPYGRTQIGADFPGLIDCEWSITRVASTSYNCIAWSVGRNDVWVDKVLWAWVWSEEHQQWEWVPVKEYYEQGTGVHHVSVDGYGDFDGTFDYPSDPDAFYLAEAGYTPTASGPGDAKVMYYHGFHAAKRTDCACGAGQWIMYESKLGAEVGIEHRHDGLDGSNCGYGDRERYYK
jgi:hypothetical protein